MFDNNIKKIGFAPLSQVSTVKVAAIPAEKGFCSYGFINKGTGECSHSPLLFFKKIFGFFL